MIPPKQKSDRELIPAGPQIAICSMIVDLGKQEVQKYMCPGQFDHKYKVSISWDFPKHRIQIEKEDGTKLDLPRRKSNTYTFSYGKKSNLGKMLKSWTGSLPASDFDLSEMLGKPALVTIAHEKGKDGETVYDNISAVTPMMDGMEAPVAENPLVSYEIHRDKMDIPDGVPNWLIEKIQSSVDWQILEKRLGNPVTNDTPPVGEDTTDYGVKDDDLRF